jgi:hypothetical protein
VRATSAAMRVGEVEPDREVAAVEALPSGPSLLLIPPTPRVGPGMRWLTRDPDDPSRVAHYGYEPERELWVELVDGGVRVAFDEVGLGLGEGEDPVVTILGILVELGSWATGGTSQTPCDGSTAGDVRGARRPAG